MLSFAEQLLASSLGAGVATGIGSALVRAGMDQRLALGIGLAAFGVAERAMSDVWRRRVLRRRLADTLAVFMAQVSQRASSHPPWEGILTQLSECLTTEADNDLRGLLLAASGEVTNLRTHKSYIAIKPSAVPSLRALAETLGGKR